MPSLKPGGERPAAGILKGQKKERGLVFRSPPRKEGGGPVPWVKKHLAGEPTKPGRRKGSPWATKGGKEEAEEGGGFKPLACKKKRKNEYHRPGR